MIIYIALDDKNYVDGWGSTRSNEDEIELQLDKEHEFFDSDFSCWKYENDELIFDEEKRDRLIVEREAEENKPIEQERIEALESALLELILND